MAAWPRSRWRPGHRRHWGKRVGDLLPAGTGSGPGVLETLTGRVGVTGWALLGRAAKRQLFRSQGAKKAPLRDSVWVNPAGSVQERPGVQISGPFLRCTRCPGAGAGPEAAGSAGPAGAAAMAALPFSSFPPLGAVRAAAPSHWLPRAAPGARRCGVSVSVCPALRSVPPARPRRSPREPPAEGRTERRRSGCGREGAGPPRCAGLCTRVPASRSEPRPAPHGAARSPAGPAGRAGTSMSPGGARRSSSSWAEGRCGQRPPGGLIPRAGRP